MKKILIYVGFFITLYSFAQDPNFGIKAGVNYSDLYGDFSEPFNAQPSFEAGFFAEFPVWKKFSFHPEILYSSRRISFEFQDPANNGGPPREGEVKNNAHNLIIPLITRYNFSDSFSLELGPQIGFLLNTTAKFDGDQFSSSGDFKFDIGPTLGVGYDQGDRFKFQLRYFIGLSDLFRKEQINGTEINNDLFTSVLSLSLGYIIF